MGGGEEPSEEAESRREHSPTTESAQERPGGGTAGAQLTHRDQKTVRSPGWAGPPQAHGVPLSARKRHPL